MRCDNGASAVSAASRVNKHKALSGRTDERLSAVSNEAG